MPERRLVRHKLEGYILSGLLALLGWQPVLKHHTDIIFTKIGYV